MTEQSDAVNALEWFFLPFLRVEVQFGVHAIAVDIFPIDIEGTDDT